MDSCCFHTTCIRSESKINNNSMRWDGKTDVCTRERESEREKARKKEKKRCIKKVKEGDCEIKID